jgi:hypothetical protein
MSRSVSASVQDANEPVEGGDFPGDCERVADAALDHREVEAYKHSSGLRVSVRRDARPTQMHDPKTSQMDEGYVAEVRDDIAAQLTHDLAAKEVARGTAREFLNEHPDGQFEVPEISEQPFDGSIDWGGE